MSASIWSVNGYLDINDNLTRYISIAPGDLSVATVEANAEIKIPADGAIDQLRFTVQTNTITANTVVTLRKNGSATALTFTISADATGTFADTSHSISVSAGDRVCIEVATSTEAGTNTITISTSAVRFTPSDTTKTYGLFGDSSINNFGTASVTRFMAVAGDHTTTSVEANAKWRARAVFTVKRFGVFVTANARTTDTVFKSRKNGADGALTVTVGAGLTGWFEDNSNSDSLSVGDDWSFALTSSTGSETLTFTSLVAYTESTEGKYPMVVAAASPNFSIAPAATNYISPQGGFQSGDPQGTEGNAKVIIPNDCTINEMNAYISANTLSVQAVLTLRKNANDTALTFTTSGTGVQTGDQSNSVSISANDEIDTKISVSSGTGAATMKFLGMIVTAVGGGGGGATTSSLLVLGVG